MRKSTLVTIYSFILTVIARNEAILLTALFVIASFLAMAKRILREINASGFLFRKMYREHVYHYFRFMKTKILSSIVLLFLFCSFQTAGNKILVYIDNYNTEVTENTFINCLKINDLSAIIPLMEEMKNYDELKLELHRFGEDIDIIAASKTFIPSSKEFQKKYANKESIKLKILAEETEFNSSDLEPNILLFPPNSTVNMVFCKSRDLKQCHFYLIFRGYKKTGEKTEFNEDIYDKGMDLSAKSVVFKSWEDKTIKKSQ